MANQKVLPVVELSEKVKSATKHFGELRVPGIDHSFTDLVSKFQVMLGPDAGTLTSRGKWMQTARLWRFVLLQREDGCFDLTDSLSFALEAHEGRRPPKKEKEKLKGFQALISVFAGEGDLDDNLDDAADDYMSSDGACACQSSGCSLCAHAPPRARASADDELAPGADELEQTSKHYKDCPISFSSTAARRRLPVSLLDLSGQHNHRLERIMSLRHVSPPAVDDVPAEPLPLQSAPLALPPKQTTRLQPHLSKFFLLAEEEADLFNGGSGESAEPEAAAPAAGVAEDEVAGALADDAANAAPSEEEEPKPVGPISVQLAERIWATVLSVSVMEDMDVCWLVDDEAEPARTVVDAAREWLEARAEEDERIKALLESGELQKEAKRAIRDWKRIMENSINQLRKNDVLNRFTALTHIQRATGRVIKSCMTDHGTFATFLDADGYIMRWQRFMILITLVLSTLLVSIWFYSSRGSQCCQEIRAMLDMGAGQVCGVTPPPSPPDAPYPPPAPPAPFTPPGIEPVATDFAIAPSGCPPVGPCLGFTGGCNDIPEQFIDLAGCYYYGDPGAEEYHEFLDEYVCHAFPDDAYVTDQVRPSRVPPARGPRCGRSAAPTRELTPRRTQFFVALIGVAVALPVDMFLQHAFEVANEVDGAPEAWLIWRGLWKMLLGKHAHANWHFTDDTKERPTELAMFIITSEDPAWPEVVTFIATWVPGRILAALKYLLGIKEKEEEEEEASEASSEASAGAEARRDRLMKRLYASAGLIGIYICWTIFSWFIFVYGMIIYKNLGPEAQNSFSQTCVPCFPDVSLLPRHAYSRAFPLVHRRWGVSYALDNCSEWQDVAIEACKVALILVVLDLLRITKDRPWFEEHVDFISIQAMLFNGAARNWWQQTRVLVRFQTRMTDE